MPRGPRGEKRSADGALGYVVNMQIRDMIGMCAKVMRIAIGEEEEG